MAISADGDRQNYLAGTQATAASGTTIWVSTGANYIFVFHFIGFLRLTNRNFFKPSATLRTRFVRTEQFCKRLFRFFPRFFVDAITHTNAFNITAD